MPGVQLKPQLPHSPVQPAPCRLNVLTGIPMAIRKEISLFFMAFPPIVDSFYRAVMSALTADNTIMQANFCSLLLHRNRSHGTGCSALFTANALLLIHLHFLREAKPTAKIMR